MRPPLLNDTVLAPTRRTIGIEDPFLQSPEAPNYFDAAWRARAFLKDASGQVPERDAIALFVNSAIVRTQDQLHIHVGCLLPYARRTLAAAAPKVPMGEWAQIGPVVPHTVFWAYRIPGTDLANVNPFRLAAEELGAKTTGPGDLTVVVVGARVDNDDQFLILASYAKAPHAWWPVGAGNLLDSCRRSGLAAPAKPSAADARFDFARSHPILGSPLLPRRAQSPLDLIASTDRGLYCAAGDFHIDPWRPVSRAIITHAHSDHARFGSEVYVCHPDTAPILRKRLGDVTIETATYGQILTRNGVELSLHPAGHVLGSAQVRVALNGETWVASGDYKLESDGVSPAFEPVRCHAFITESTFGLPIYRWRPQADIFAAIDAWRRENIAAGRASIVYAYALGKAQRLIAGVDPALGPIVCHGAIEAINALYREAGVALPPTRLATQIENKRDFARALIVAPPSAAATPWLKRFGDYSDALASGWMQVRGNRRRRGLDRGFALSDHADWPGLIAAIEATGAERILVTHGYTETLTRYLREKGLDARALTTSYGDDEDVGDAAAPAEAEA